MNKNDNRIYFLENIISHYSNSINEVSKYSLVLLNVTSESNILSIKDDLDFEIREVNFEQINNIHEGQYLQFIDGKFLNANNTSIAKRNIYYNNLYRGKLIKKQKIKSENLPFFSNPLIYSYHINVGHGNCSIIFIKNKKLINIWMVDCSVFDYRNKKYYEINLEKCFKHILNKFNLKRIRLNKFFLTHTHYDHYSGTENLINKKIIDSETVFYLNLHYSMPSKNYNRLLYKINKLNSIIIEPLPLCSKKVIEVWHPHHRTIRSRTKNYSNQTVQVESKPNNSSAVYYFKIGKKSILFLGDLETPKLNTIQCCPNYLKNSDYFVVSHHASINGHIRNNCPAGRNISNLSECIYPSSIAIIMGRDGAFPGIYSKQVINDFKNLVYSEKNINNQKCQFLEIDWQNNKSSWII